MRNKANYKTCLIHEIRNLVQDMTYMLKQAVLVGPDHVWHMHPNRERVSFNWLSVSAEKAFVDSTKKSTARSKSKNRTTRC